MHTKENDASLKAEKATGGEELKHRKSQTYTIFFSNCHSGNNYDDFCIIM